MKIAVSTEGERVAGHFGRCPHFTLITIDDGKIIEEEVLKKPRP